MPIGAKLAASIGKKMDIRFEHFAAFDVAVITDAGAEDLIKQG
jgi:hypothetical protein